MIPVVSESESDHILDIQILDWSDSVRHLNIEENHFYGYNPDLKFTS